MAEPTSTGSAGLAVVLIALLGPAAGEYATIVFAALAGSLWPLSSRSSPSRSDGAFFVIRLVLTASVLTSVVSWYVERKLSLPTHNALAPVAFSIGAIGDNWKGLITAITSRLRKKIGGDKQ
jgi:hypothetical protein